MRAPLLLTAIGSILLIAGCVDGGGGSDTSDTTSSTSSESTSSTDSTGSDSTSSDSTTTPAVTASPFSVTIENTTDAPQFVRAGAQLPFAVSQGAQKFVLTTECSCAKCGGGAACPVSDPLTAVVEIGAGESLVVDMDLSWYVDVPVPEDCKELAYLQTCSQPNAFAAGDYDLRVDWGGEQAMIDQEFSDSGNTQWGHPVWTNPYLFVGVDFAGSVNLPFSVVDGATTLHVQIGN